MTLEEFLRNRLAADPKLVGTYAQRRLKLLCIHKRRWRGQVITKTAKVEVDGKEVTAAVTTPRWTFLPDEIKKAYQKLEMTVNTLLQALTIGGSINAYDDQPASYEAEAIGALLRGGLYLVDEGNLPLLIEQLQIIQIEWRALAVKYATEDGYQNLRDLIREKVGDEVFAEVEQLIPQPNELLSKCSLIWQHVPVQFVADKTNKDDNGAGALAVGAIATIVRRSREKLASACEAVLEKLALKTANGDLTVLETITSNAAEDGASRAVRGDTLFNARKALDEFDNYKEYADISLITAIDNMRLEFPADKDACTAVAKASNRDASLAIRLARAADDVIKIARSEASMIAALAGKL